MVDHRGEPAPDRCRAHTSLVSSEDGRMTQRVLLVGDTSNRANWGCRVTSAGLRRLIEEEAEIVGALDMRRLAEPVPARVPLTALSESPSRRPSIADRATRRIKRALSRRDPWDEPTATSLDQIADAIADGDKFPHLTDAIRRVDTVIVNGEGSVLKDRSGGRQLLAIAYAAKTRLGRRVAIVNHTADLGPKTRALAERVYPVVDDVRVREPLSFRELASIADPSHFGLAADAAFAYPDEVKRIRRSRPRIVLGGSAAYHRHLRDPSDMVPAYLELAALLGRLGDVVLSAASAPDDRFLKPVADQLGLPYFGLATPTDVAVELLAGADIYVGGRWHPAILASKAAVPVVVFESNSRNKMTGLLELLGTQQEFLAADPLDVSRIFELTEERLADRQEVRLAERARELASSARENVRVLTS